MSVIVKVTRRDFLRRTGVGAGAFVLGCYINPGGVLEARNLVREARNILKHGLPLNAFVSMHLDGVVEIMAPRSEMGQGIRYSLASVLADELEADWTKIKVIQSDADGARYSIGNPNVNVNPNASPAYLINDELSQFADSSRSMALFYMPMRLFGAGIRLVMIKAAAKKWGVDPSECYAKLHHVHQKGSSRSEPYNHLLLEAAMVGLPQMPEILEALKPEKDWTYIGTKNMPFNDANDMVTGKAVYGADVDLPGMLTAMVVRCPVANGGVKSFDDSETRKVPGVVNVVKIDLGPMLRGGVGGGFMPHCGVAVVAKNTWAALQGRRALKVEWDLSGLAAINATYDSDIYRGKLEEATASGANAEVLRNKGDVYAALSAAGPDAVKADYYVPHLAQAPMEPPVTTARYQNGRWEIWTSSQGPELLQHYVGLAMLYAADPVKWLAWQATEPRDVRPTEEEDQKLFNKEYSTLQGETEHQMFEERDRLKREIRDKVKVHVTLLGGGFGRKSKPDFAVEAAFLAREHPGVPVRVQWTREDDIQFSYFHAVSNQHLEAVLDGSGKPTTWLQRSAFPSFFATLFPGYAGTPPIFLTARKAFHNGGKFPYGSGIEKAHGLEDMPFSMQNIRIENCPAQNHIRVGWMRSVSNIFHAFSACSFAHELAIKANAPDPKKYLLDLIGEGGILDLEAEGVTAFDNNGFPAFRPEGNPAIIARYPPDTRRLRGVIDKVAEISGWDQKYGKLGDSRGLGIAAHRSFLSYVAIVCDVSLIDRGDKKELKINEIFGVIDCGRAVNVDRVLAQMEGGIVYGLSYALLGEITVKEGKVVQSNFDNYPVARLHQTPKITVDYIRSSADPTGAGEPPTPAVAPALANAIVAAGGPRIREIPFYRKVVVN